jgi:hypothetical protein
MAYEGVLVAISGAEASADLSTHQFKFVTMTSTGAALNTVAKGLIDGVLQDKPNALAQPANVAFSGVSKVVAGAIVAKGALVMSDATGKAVTATSTGYICGRALEASGADGDFISVLLDTKGYVP